MGKHSAALGSIGKDQVLCCRAMSLSSAGSWQRGPQLSLDLPLKLKNAGDPGAGALQAPLALLQPLHRQGTGRRASLEGVGKASGRPVTSGRAAHRNAAAALPVPAAC